MDRRRELPRVADVRICGAGISRTVALRRDDDRLEVDLAGDVVTVNLLAGEMARKASRYEFGGLVASGPTLAPLAHAMASFLALEHYGILDTAKAEVTGNPGDRENPEIIFVEGFVECENTVAWQTLTANPGWGRPVARVAVLVGPLVPEDTDIYYAGRLRDEHPH